MTQSSVSDLLTKISSGEYPLSDFEICGFKHFSC